MLRLFVQLVALPCTNHCDLVSVLDDLRAKIRRVASKAVAALVWAVVEDTATAVV